MLFALATVAAGLLLDPQSAGRQAPATGIPAVLAPDRPVSLLRLLHTDADTRASEGNGSTVALESSYSATLPEYKGLARLEADGGKPSVDFLQVNAAEAASAGPSDPGPSDPAAPYGPVERMAEAARTAVLNAMKHFYAKAAEDIAFLQQPEIDFTSAAPKHFEGSYKDNSTGALVGLLEVIRSDFARLEEVTNTAEDEASNEHERFFAESKRENPAKWGDLVSKTYSKEEALVIGMIAACAASFYAISGFGYAILFHALWLCASLCGYVHGGVQRAVICIILAGPALVAMQMSMLMFTSRAHPTNTAFCATWCTTTLLGVISACVPMIGRRHVLVEHLLWVLFVVVCTVEWYQVFFKGSRKTAQRLDMSIPGVATSVILLGLMSGFGQGALAAGGGTKIIMVLCLQIPLDEWRIAATLADWPVHAVRFMFYHYHGDVVLSTEWPLACALIIGQVIGLALGNYCSRGVNTGNVARFLLIFLTGCAMQLTHKLLFHGDLWKTLLLPSLAVSLSVGTALLLVFVCTIRGKVIEMRSSLDWYMTWVVKKQSSNYMQGWSDLVSASFGVATWWLRPPPTVWIIGEKKCGTTSLHWYLTQHDNMLSGIAKEQHLFDCRNIFGWKFEGPEFLKIRRGFFPTSARYVLRRLFSPHGISTPVHCVDGTPTNLMLPWAASAIKQLHSGYQPPKIIVLLRDPVERAVSDYRYEVARSKETRSFHDALEAEVNEDAWFWEGGTWSQCVASASLKPMWEHERLRPDVSSRMPDEHAYRRRGNYLEHLQPYYDAFGAENITVISTDELSSDPHSTVNKILIWLDLPPLQALDAERKNVTRNDKSTITISDDETRRLAQYYAPGLAALHKQLQFPYARIWLQKWFMNDSRSLQADTTPEAGPSEGPEPAEPEAEPGEMPRCSSGESVQKESPAMYSTAPSTPELRKIM